MAGTLPFVVVVGGAGFGGQRFDLVNWICIPLGVAIFVAPLLVLTFAQGLVPVVGALAVTRVLAWWYSIFVPRFNSFASWSMRF